jgi:hypothetical protein
MRDPKPTEVQAPDPRVRRSLSQRLLSRWLIFAYSAPETVDPPRNTFLRWFRFIGILAGSLALLGGSIWWIAAGSYTDSYHQWHNEAIRGIQNPLYLGGFGVLGILYALTLRPWRAQKQKAANKQRVPPPVDR